MFDKTKPFGEVCGPPPFPGAIFNQNEKYYNREGQEVFEDGNDQKLSQKEEDDAREEAKIAEEAAAEADRKKFLQEAKDAEVEESKVVGVAAGDNPVPPDSASITLRAQTTLAQSNLPSNDELRTMLGKDMTHTQIAEVWGCTRQKITRLVKDMETE